MKRGDYSRIANEWRAWRHAGCADQDRCACGACTTGRELPPMQPDEALRAARKLFAMLGRRVTPKLVGDATRKGWPRVSPRWGWERLVHAVSHDAFSILRPSLRPHDRRHATIELRMTRAVIARGWLDGKLRRAEKPEPAPPTRDEARYLLLARKTALRDRWIGKQQRAERAIAKLDRSIKALERAAAKARDAHLQETRPCTAS
jgi:hypothetical protein